MGGVGGLEYKCNEFNTRINFDVNLPDAPGGVASLIRNQGLCVSIDPQKQAGNIYYPCISSISSEELNFGAISLVDNPDFLYQDHSSTMPTCTNNTTILCTGTPSANSCPSNFSICSTIPCLTTLYTSSSLAAKEILDAYKLLLDGGNTSYLLNQINSSLPAGQLKNLLLSKSPYLSDTVLVGTLTRSDLPPYGHLEQIMLANSPLSISVVQALENVGLPVGILNNIMSAQSGVSARKQKENEIDYYAFQTKLAAVSLKQEYLKSENMDSVKIVLQNDTTLTGLFNTLELLIDMEEYVEAQIYLSRIQAIEGAVYSDRTKLNAMKLNLAKNNKTWFDMTPAQYNIIKQIYDNNQQAAIEARTILLLTKGLQYERYPFDSQMERSMSSEGSEISNPLLEISQFKVYPNPSSDYTKVEIQLEEEIFQAELLIYNLLGAEILRQTVKKNEVLTVNNKEFNSGIYLYVLKTEQGIVEKQKIIISK